MSDSLRLTLLSPADNATFDLDEVPLETTAAQLVQDLVRQGAVPALPNSQSYLLALKGGHQLDESVSLAANGVTSGATLQLIAPTPGAALLDLAAVPAKASSIQVRRREPVAPTEARPPLPELFCTRNEDAPVRVYVSIAALRRIWGHVGRRCYACGCLPPSINVERGGALVGEYAVDPNGRRFIVINDIVSATNAPATRTTINMRAEDWVQIHAEIERMEGQRLLGWYHSHPSLGVFMSGTDKETQRRTFAADWQVGLVVDPNDETFAFFVGEHSQPATWVALFDEHSRCELQADTPKEALPLEAAHAAARPTSVSRAARWMNGVSLHCWRRLISLSVRVWSSARAVALYRLW